MAEICSNFARSQNSFQAGFGFYEHCEKEIEKLMDANKVSFSEGTKVVESLFKNNIGSTKFQTRMEDYLSERVEHEETKGLIRLAIALYDPKYMIKSHRIHEDLMTALSLNIQDLDIRKLETLFWAMTRNEKFYQEVVDNNPYSKMVAKSLLNTVFRR